jgi:UDP-2-acetamido-2,6-beta-L-arabino-hexul-4-ose reductase
MIQFLENYMHSEDSRGVITGLINTGSWREINLISSDSGVTRGNHYHKATREGFAILKGVVQITLQPVDKNKLSGEVCEYIVNERKVFVIEPMTNHIFTVLEDATWINFLDQPMTADAPDIHRCNED